MPPPRLAPHSSSMPPAARPLSPSRYRVTWIITGAARLAATASTSMQTKTSFARQDELNSLQLHLLHADLLPGGRALAPPHLLHAGLPPGGRALAPPQVACLLIAVRLIADLLQEKGSLRDLNGESCVNKLHYGLPISVTVLQVIPSILLALGMVVSPESPHWLFQVCVWAQSEEEAATSEVVEGADLGIVGDDTQVSSDGPLSPAAGVETEPWEYGQKELFTHNPFHATWTDLLNNIIQPPDCLRIWKTLISIAISL
ncbi:hypothetical protein ABZP36_033766 [Zizania latifolia]